MSKTEQKQANIPPSETLILTQAAQDKIKSMMAKDGKEGCGLRLSVVTGGCAGLSYDMRFQKQPYENDEVIKQKEFDVFVNPQSFPYLKGITVDYVDTLKESGFKYINPNASSSCGCGTSFS